MAASKLRFADLPALNAWLATRCTELAQRSHPDHPDRTVDELWQEKRASLQPMLPAFDGFHERICRVTSIALVHFERNRYSVECVCAGRTVAVRVYAVIVADRLVIGEHDRQFGRYKTAYDPLIGARKISTVLCAIRQMHARRRAVYQAA